MRVHTIITLAALTLTATAACDTSVVDAGDGAALSHRRVSANGPEIHVPSRVWTMGTEIPNIGTPPAPPTPEQLCADRAARIADGVDRAREAAGGCVVDADCTVSHANVKCDTVRGNIWPVSFTGRRGFEDAVRGVEEVECAGWVADEDACPVAIMDYFVPPSSRCVEGMCQLEAGSLACTEPNADGAAPLGAANTVEGCLDCGLAEAKARAEVSAAVATVDACEVDSDCVIVSDSTDCGGGCGVAINAAAAAGWNSVLDAASDDYCFANGGCPVMVVDCLPTRAFCDAGTCRATTEPEIAICTFDEE